MKYYFKTLKTIKVMSNVRKIQKVRKDCLKESREQELMSNL